MHGTPKSERERETLSCPFPHKRTSMCHVPFLSSAPDLDSPPKNMGNRWNPIEQELEEDTCQLPTLAFAKCQHGALKQEVGETEFLHLYVPGTPRDLQPVRHDQVVYFIQTQPAQRCACNNTVLIIFCSTAMMVGWTHPYRHILCTVTEF